MRLIIAPHIDDDVIGCGGILDEECLVYYCGVDSFHVVDKEQRVLEAKAVQKVAGHRFLVSENNTVNSYELTSIKNELEFFVNQYKPEEVLLPWPSYNQDHQTVYNAAMIALRPHDKNHFVKRVLLYEEPDCFWPGIKEAFKPQLYREIDIERKLTLYRLMPSQIRQHRSEDALRALSMVRGATIGVPTAEAFSILRWVE